MILLKECDLLLGDGELSMKDELRHCKVEIPKRVRYSVMVGGHKFLDKILESESHKAKFHKWVDGDCGEDYPKTNVCGLVEYDDGTMHLIPHEYIIFTDKKNVTINIDVIGNTVAEMSKE